MIERSEAEIKAKVNELWSDREENRRDLDVEVRKTSSGTVEIDISSMYSAPGLKFSYLKALSEFFGTESINDDEAFNESGCETCDWGSKYGYTLTIRPN